LSKAAAVPPVTPCVARDPRTARVVVAEGGAADNRPGSPTELRGTTAGATGSISSNGSSLTLGQGLVIGGVAAALSGEPVLGAGLAIAGLIASSNTASKGNTVQGGATNSVVNLSSNAAIAAGALSVVSSDPLPLFSFAAAIASEPDLIQFRPGQEEALFQYYNTLYEFLQNTKLRVKIINRRHHQAQSMIAMIKKEYGIE
jgi:hypothetical protein